MHAVNSRVSRNNCKVQWLPYVKIFSSIIAAMGKQLKQSVKVFHSLMLYRLLPADQSQLAVALCVYPLTRTFIIKAVYTVDGRAFVVAAKDEEVFWILDLHAERT